jgi:hypothetical protein
MAYACCFAESAGKRAQLLLGPVFKLKEPNVSHTTVKKNCHLKPLNVYPTLVLCSFVIRLFTLKPLANSHHILIWVPHFWFNAL